MWKATRLCLLALGIASAAMSAPAAERLDVNTADAQALAETLTGVGDVRARAIVEHRERNGDFPSVDALTDVDGVGPATLESNRGRLTVGAD